MGAGERTVGARAARVRASAWWSAGGAVRLRRLLRPPRPLDVDAWPGLRSRMRELGGLGAAAGALREASPAGGDVARIERGDEPAERAARRTTPSGWASSWWSATT
ncbi:hypothetical protein QJS66_22305 [Kocuria rhizophila]|nr:hypothetical protein QJS66_22305 [Kocuria rhizophila]